MNALSAAAHLRRRAEWPGIKPILIASAVVAIVAAVSPPFAAVVGACLATGFVWRALSLSTAWLLVPSLVALAVTGLLAGLELGDASEVVAVVSYLGLATAVGVRLAAARGRSRRVVPNSEVARGRWDYALCGGVALLAAQSWFTAGSVLALGDFYPLSFTDPATVLEKVSPLWNSLSSGTGGRNFTIVQFPFVAVSAGLQELGLSGPAAQRMLLSVLFAGEVVSALFLIRTLWPRASAPARVAGALFYAFNPLAFYMVPGPTQMLALVLMPLLGGIMLRSLRDGGRRGPLLWALCSVGLAYVGANPPLALVVAFTGVALPAIVFLAEGGSIDSIGRFLARVVPMSLLFNLWWLVPALLTITSTPVSEIPSSPEEWGWTQVRNSIANVFTLNTGWGWNDRIYYPYAGIYGSPIVAVAMYLPAIVAFSAVVFKKTRDNRVILLFASFTLVLMFLSKGIHGPFDEVNRFLFEHVPGVALFREPALKLLPVVSVLMALLVAASIDAAAEKLRRGRARAEGVPSHNARRVVVAGSATFVLAAGLALPTAAMPLATGDVVADERPVLPGTHVRVPEYWRALARFLDSSPRSGSVVLLPLSDYYQMPYTWGYYGTDGWASEMIDRPVIFGGELTYISSSAAQRAARSLARAVLQGEPEQALWRARSLGARFIVVRDDIDQKVLTRFGRRLPKASAFEASLAQNPSIDLVERWGPLSLYEVDGGPTGPFSAWGDVGWWSEGEGFPPAGVFSADIDPAVLARPDGTPVSARDEEVRALASTHTPVVSSRRRDLTAVRIPIAGTERRIGGTPILTLRGEPTELSSRGRYYVQFDSSTPQPAALDEGRSLTAFARWGEASMVRVKSPGAQQVRGGFFEEGVSAWSPARDCAHVQASRTSGARATLTRDSYEGDRALRLSARGRLGCVIQPLGLLPGKTYELSVAYRRVEGRLPRVCLFAQTRRGPSHCVNSPPRGSGSGWQHFTEAVKVPPGTFDTRLFLYANGSGSQRTVSLYDAVSVRKLDDVRSYEMLWEEGVEQAEWERLESIGSRVTSSAPQPNLVRNDSFRSRTGARPSGWSRVGDCNRVEEGTLAEHGISARVVAQGSDGPGALRLAADSNSGCISQRIDVQPGETYSLSLTHREAGAGDAALCVLIPTRNQCLSLSPLTSSTDWITYEARFNVPSSDRYVELYLYAPSTGRGTTVNFYDEVQVRALSYEPQLFVALRGEGDAQPQVDVVAEGAARYRISVSGATAPFALTLDQSYDRDWQLHVVGDTKVRAEHLVANGFSNGWLLDGPSSFEVIVEFGPERWARWGYWASAVAILVACAVAVASKARGRPLSIRRER